MDIIDPFVVINIDKRNGMVVCKCGFINTRQCG